MGYLYTKERERELLSEGFQLYSNHQPKTLLDIFKIDTGITSAYEKFYVQSIIMLYTKFQIVDKNDEYLEQESYQGGYIDLNSKYKNAIIIGVTEFSINSLYPTIMINLKDEEICNLTGLKQTYEDLFVEYRNMPASDKDKYPNLAMEAKGYLNRMFGMLSGSKPNSYLKSLISGDAITSKARHLMRMIKSEFAGHFIYTDTDAIYFIHFEEIEDRLHKFMDKQKKRYRFLDYDIEKHEKGLFLEKKRYVLFDEKGNSKIRGYKTIS